MLNKYVAVATDLDSTFMHHGMTIPARNIMAVQRATAAGLHFVVASGRQQPAIAKVMHKVGVNGAKVCLNGAYVVDEAAHVLVASAIDPQMIVELFALASAAGANMMCYQQRGVVRYDVTNSLLWHALFLGHDRRNRLFKHESRLRHLLATRMIYKVGFNHPDHTVLVGIQQQLAKREALTMVWASANFLEITNAGITKLTGLAALARQWHTDVSRFIAFGDYENDLAMLEGVGFGVAMSNAIPAVKAVAKQVVDNHDHQGVGRALEQLLETPRE